MQGAFSIPLPGSCPCKPEHPAAGAYPVADGGTHSCVRGKKLLYRGGLRLCPYPKACPGAGGALCGHRHCHPPARGICRNPGIRLHPLFHSLSPGQKNLLHAYSPAAAHVRGTGADQRKTSPDRDPAPVCKNPSAWHLLRTDCPVGILLLYLERGRYDVAGAFHRRAGGKQRPGDAAPGTGGADHAAT